MSVSRASACHQNGVFSHTAISPEQTSQYLLAFLCSSLWDTQLPLKHSCKYKRQKLLKMGCTPTDPAWQRVPERTKLVLAWIFGAISLRLSWTVRGAGRLGIRERRVRLHNSKLQRLQTPLGVKCQGTKWKFKLSHTTWQFIKLRNHWKKVGAEEKPVYIRTSTTSAKIICHYFKLSWAQLLHTKTQKKKKVVPASNIVVISHARLTRRHFTGKSSSNKNKMSVHKRENKILAMHPIYRFTGRFFKWWRE